nr:MAG TPA: hypothetical protein [Caudoviricetes sp.]
MKYFLLKVLTFHLKCNRMILNLGKENKICLK